MANLPEKERVPSAVWLEWLALLLVPSYQQIIRIRGLIVASLRNSWCGGQCRIAGEPAVECRLPAR